MKAWSLLLVAFGALSLGARGCVWDSWSQQSQTSSTGTSAPLATCIPALCSFSCVSSMTPEGIPAHPIVNPQCPIEDFNHPSQEIRTWVTATLALTCADPPVGDVMFIPVPAALVCSEGTCAPNPSLLAPSCVATCRVSGSPPTLASACPDPNENTAMEEFVLSLEGIICNDQATDNNYTLAPDPSLVDTTVCAHKGHHP